MKLYDLYNPHGHAKLLAVRRGLIDLKHEVKSLLKAGVQAVPVDRLNERLQHIAKIPHAGLPKLRCNGRCRCKRGLVDQKLDGRHDSEVHAEREPVLLHSGGPEVC